MDDLLIKELNETIVITAWAEDFLQAARKRPLWVRVLFGWIIGKYAYRELIGLMDALEAAGYSPYWDYSIEGCEYHKDKVPRWWWKEPLKDDVE